MPSAGLEEWLVKVRAYQQAHPGHCGRCGLPFEHCIHRDPEYRKDQSPHRVLPTHRAIEGISQVQAIWYRKKVDAMPVEAVLKLPPPPTNFFKGQLQDWAARNLDRVEDSHEPPTLWERLLDA